MSEKNNKKNNNIATSTQAYIRLIIIIILKPALRPTLVYGGARVLEWPRAIQSYSLDVAKKKGMYIHNRKKIRIRPLPPLLPLLPSLLPPLPLPLLPPASSASASAPLSTSLRLPAD